MPVFGSNPQDDPLGIALIGRAQDAARKSYFDNWGHPSFGPLPDPQWQGLMQAFSEKGVDKLVGGNVPGSDAFTGVPITSRARTIPQASGERGEMAPQQLLPGYGAPDNRSSIMNGLTSAFQPESGVGGVNPAYQTHEQWMGSNPAAQAYQTPGQFGIEQQHIANPRNRRATGMPVVGQRGTTGSNISQRYGKPNPNE